MKFSISLYHYMIACCLGLSFAAQSQPTAASDTILPNNSSALFANDELLQIKITGQLSDVLNDRDDDSKYHSFRFSYFNKDNSEVTMPVKIKTRGHFRKEKSNCVWPPLLINFAKKDMPRSCLFEGQDKLKLVMPCRGEEYVVREWLLYKLYNLITPKSFRARLVKVIMEDSARQKQSSFYGILLEDEDQMAFRNKTVVVDRKRLNPLNTDHDVFITMAVFQYMIGNTDWSVEFQQNIKLLAKDSLDVPVTVPYDFDHAGLVDAPYAKPADELEMTSVRERRFRGYCVPEMKIYDQTVALFNKLKKDFYSVYTDCTFLSPKYIKTATKYLDDFYATINDPKALRQAFAYPCDKDGTGNIIIKGMKKN